MDMDMNRAEAIIDRATSTGKRIAVFIVGGSVTATNTSTALNKKLCDSPAAVLVGVYDWNADPEWIVDDVTEAKNKAGQYGLQP